jgi:hypothetical protein
MFLRRHQRSKDGTPHPYRSLVETVRTPDGPRQRTLCYLGELKGSTRARCLRTNEVFNEHGESRQWKLFPSEIEPPENDAGVAQEPGAAGRRDTRIRADGKTGHFAVVLTQREAGGHQYAFSVA